MGISIKSKSKDGFVLSVDSVENETKQYGLKVTATLDDGTVLPSVTKDVTLEYIPVNVISVTGAATITDAGEHAYTLAYGPADANVGVASVLVTTDKTSSVLAITSQSTSGFTLRAGSLSTTANVATVTVKATLTNGVEVTQTKSVTLQKVTASISGPDSFRARGGTGSQAYTFAYTPSDHTSTISLRSATSSNSAFTITSATAAGLTLGIVDMPAEPETISTTVTAVLVIDGVEQTVTREVSAVYTEILAPFILYNAGASAAVGLQRTASVPMTKLYYAVVNDYQEGQEYDDSSVEYSVYENTGTDAKTIATVPQGSALLLKADEKARWGTNVGVYTRFNMTSGAFKAYGPIGSLDGYGNTLASCCYQNMFMGCTSLTAAPALPATTLAGYCYYSMFNGCTGLTQAPALPATTLANVCYQNMFMGCTSLTAAPALPATKVSGNSYYGMFMGCTSLTAAPALPATTLDSYCYYSMFSGCTSLTTAPALPATTLDSYCYYSMFSGCTSLTTAPALPAKSLSAHCYQGIFFGCTSLTQAPALPSLYPRDYSYCAMFMGCTSLTTAPALPAYSLQTACYLNMFNGCTSLTTAPALPAVYLAGACYQGMFSGCSALTSVKAMFTTTPGSSYTNGWLSGVSASGTFVKNQAATWDVTGESGVPSGWTIKQSDGYLDVPEFKAKNGAGSVDCSFGVYLEGKYIASSSSSNSAMRLEGIENGIRLSVSDVRADVTSTITIQYKDSYESGTTYTYTKDVTATYVEAVDPFILYNAGASAAVGLQRSSTAVPMTKLYYAVVNDYQEGQEYDDSSVEYSVYENTGTSELTIATVPQGSALLLKAYKKARWSLNVASHTRFVMTAGAFKANGAIGSLDGYSNTLADWCYFRMFRGCTSLTTAPALPATALVYCCYNSMFNGCTGLTTAPALPATSLARICYSSMFYGCTGLTTAPALPATTLENYCYQNMFQGCTGLTTAPALPATTLVDSCYSAMFWGCTGLTQAPALPATTLASYCYGAMFYGCTGLTTAPALPVTTLPNQCYQNMFNGCTSLTTAPALPATQVSYNSYYGMFWGCTSLTTAPALSATTLASYCYYSMFRGCTGLTTAPALPATTLKDNCYSGMFNGCTSLNYVQAMFTTTPDSNYTNDWLSGVSASGTFVKNSVATWDVTGASGVPSGWTIEYATE